MIDGYEKVGRDIYKMLVDDGRNDALAVISLGMVPADLMESVEMVLRRHIAESALKKIGVDEPSEELVSDWAKSADNDEVNSALRDIVVGIMKAHEEAKA